jgi:glycine dehydrogenase subunit 1
MTSAQSTAAADHFQSHYIPNTPEEQTAMLATLGLTSIDELFADIPADYRNPTLDLPSPLSELDIQRELGAMAARNRPLGGGPSFLGAGSYQHFIPSIVKALITRGEFLTAYTPYQAEASQGTLQVIYEFQTLISSLYGMEVANAGMYDGATSLAEAALMACRVTQRAKVTVLNTVSLAYADVIRTYCQSQDIRVETVDPESPGIDSETACLVSQYPNFFGYIEDLGNLNDAAHQQGALGVVSCDPIAVGMFQPPGHYGADIVTGEGQPLGIPTSYGGPYVGLFSCRQQHIRQMPSRLSGRTVDRDGKIGYVLTLQTREQHIRRERATSNICTNEALYALASTIYLAALGKVGLRQVAELCYHKAHYAASQIAGLPGFSAPISGTFFKEFVVECPAPPAEINRKLMERNILGGLDVSDRIPNGMLLCVTEMNSKEDIDSLVTALEEAG